MPPHDRPPDTLDCYTRLKMCKNRGSQDGETRSLVRWSGLRFRRFCNRFIERQKLRRIRVTHLSVREGAKEGGCSHATHEKERRASIRRSS